MSVRHLEKFFAPRAVAVIGASDRPRSVGATVWRNLRDAGYAGIVYPVNPGHDQLDGVPVLRDAADLPDGVDLALVCTPPASLPAIVASLAARGVQAAIVMTAGLDAATRQRMLDAARPTTMRLLGPNCLGLLSPHAALNASFAHVDALPGELAFVTQSGAIGTAVLDWARSRRIGLSCLVSLGDGADVDFGDLLDFLAGDVRTRAILLYVESVVAARKFMSAARAAARNKPVIVVKAGRAGRGIAAAMSHTGALAGSDAVYDAAIRRAGMLRVDTLAELFGAAEALSRFGPGRDAPLTIVTNGGGAGVLAADAAAREDVALAELDAATLAQLDAALPANWSHANPIDMIGDAPVERYTHTLQTLLATPASGTLLFVHAPTAIVPSREIAQACVALAREHAGRLMSCWLGADGVAQARRLFEDAGIADYPTPEDAIHALAMLQAYRRNQAQLDEAPASPEFRAPDLQAVRAIVDRALRGGAPVLAEDESKALLEAFGIPVIPTRRCAPDAQAAADEAALLGFPVALKIVSPDLTHKSDVGGVALGLRDRAAVQAAARAMLDRIAAARPQARIEAFSVQRMAASAPDRELIVGASVDPVFGPVILFGHGGTAVERIGDRALALPPLNRTLARALIARTQVARLLDAYRDRPAADLDAICDVLVRIGWLMAEVPEVAELDINPLCPQADGVVALDARIRLDARRPAGREHFAIVPYPQALEARVDWQGRTLLIRPIRPEDTALHRDFIAAMPAGDFRLRFFNVAHELSRRETARLVQIDYAREMAFVAIDPGDGAAPRMLGVARAVIDPDNQDAEFAVAIAASAQRHGLARLLMDRLIDYLRERGTQRLCGVSLHENVALHALAHGLGFRSRIDRGQVCHTLDLAPAAGT